MKNKPVIVEETFDAPVERVWQALTDKNKMKQWYFDLEAFEPKVGFEFSFAGKGHKGEQYIHLCKVTEVIPGKRIQYSWKYKDYQGYSLVTFDLFEEGTGTRLRVTHDGLETFPQNNPDFAAKSFSEGWTELITKLLPKYLKTENLELS